MVAVDPVQVALSAEREGGETAAVRVLSEAGATLRLANPFDGAAAVIRSSRQAEERYVSDGVIVIETEAGEELEIERG